MDCIGPRAKCAPRTSPLSPLPPQQMAVLATTQPRQSQPWVAFSTSWQNTTQTMETHIQNTTRAVQSHIHPHSHPQATTKMALPALMSRGLAGPLVFLKSWSQGSRAEEVVEESDPITTSGCLKVLREQGQGRQGWRVGWPRCQHNT